MTKRKKTLAIASGAAALLIAGGLMLVGWTQPKPTERSFTIEAQQYAYTPAVIKVNKGDRVTVKLKARDVTHGFFLEGYDLDAKARPEMPTFWARHPSTEEDYETVDEVSFIADKEGKFRYRCSQTCGYMHPFMQGEFIVRPNRLFPASILLAIAVTGLSLFWFARKEGE